MLDHMLFNKLKWFNIANNATTIQANGKKWRAYPQTITVDGSCNFTIASGGGQIQHDGPDDTYTCLGSFDGHYVVNGHAGEIEGHYGLLLVPEDYVASVNWGGKTHTIGLYQRLRSLFYPCREVV